MTVIASLRFIGQVRGFSGAELESRIEEVVGKVALEPVLNKKVETLSKGYCRRLGIAQALIHDPKVLILDEPTDGLDPNQKHQVRQLIHDLSEDKIVVVSTHILEEVSAVCSRAMILAQGSIVFDGTPDELAAMSEHHNAVKIRLSETKQSVIRRLESLPLVSSVESDELGNIEVFPVDGEAILASVNAVLHEEGCQIEALHVETGQLDDVFRKVTNGAEQSERVGGAS
jgi:ABC-2 type transport system ATP-binding protein